MWMETFVEKTAKMQQIHKTIISHMCGMKRDIFHLPLSNILQSNSVEFLFLRQKGLNTYFKLKQNDLA